MPSQPAVASSPVVNYTLMLADDVVINGRHLPQRPNDQAQSSRNANQHDQQVRELLVEEEPELAENLYEDQPDAYRT